MISIQGKRHFYLVSSVQFILFLPFLFQQYIGSDWDSYALIGTVFNLYENGTYLPSRPPGFPVYEIALTLLYSISNFFKINFEILYLLFQLVFVFGNNFLIFSFFKKFGDKNYILYYSLLLSPIYLISGFTVIDYHAGLFFGFLAVYFSLYTSKSIYLTSLFLAISVGIRLSNVFFIASVLLILFKNRENFSKIFLTIFSTSLFSLFFYIPSYINLWNTSLSESLTNPIDMFCIFNLTNTDHSFVDRIGRFILKQIDFFGLIGSLLILYISLKIRSKAFKDSSHFIILFLLFELSFLRLPTEEGHLLPAVIALVLTLKSLDIKIFIQYIILISAVLSNFIYFSIYDVDKPDKATAIYFNFEIEQGLLLQDYELRNEIGIEKDFHYNNAFTSIQNVWGDGCPNK
jgi:hypothetical protein